MALAAIAGVLRWVSMALTTKVMALALAVAAAWGSPSRRCILLACASSRDFLYFWWLTAQAMYAFGAAAITALLTRRSGRLYATLGAEGFLAMALLCAAAAPFTLGLRSTHAKTGRAPPTLMTRGPRYLCSVDLRPQPPSVRMGRLIRCAQDQRAPDGGGLYIVIVVDQGG